ncbi:hypothetical protein MAR_022495 [Mya arenaria]|uniref:Uncharacterized protein n=1 Tax=Mya arenaria TaxID=6604 RepID=A0ABY7DKB4_MYAAR|nr:hypothetical protein MAR_022495 [Mya arenaria]
MGWFALLKWWPFGDYIASGLPPLAVITLLLWGGLEIFAIWKRLSFKRRKQTGFTIDFQKC